MEPNFHSKDRVREQASIAQDLKGVARKMNTIVMTAAQLNTSNMESDQKITTDDVKYCRAIGENCDWLAGFRQSDSDKAMKQVRLELAKHRFSASATALLEIDFDTMQISDLGHAEDVPQPEPTTADLKASERKQRSGIYSGHGEH
jgi:replicative DNA helicase